MHFHAFSMEIDCCALPKVRLRSPYGTPKQLVATVAIPECRFTAHDVSVCRQMARWFAGEILTLVETPPPQPTC